MKEKDDPYEESAPRIWGVPLFGAVSGLALPMIPDIAASNLAPGAAYRFGCEVASLAAVPLILRYAIKPRKRTELNTTTQDFWLFVLSYCPCSCLILYVGSHAGLPPGTSFYELVTLAILGFGAGQLTLFFWTPTEAEPNACASCGYDLRGADRSASAICPECGKPRS